MRYLCRLLDNTDEPYTYTYGFVRDRSRGVRQDFTVQNVPNGGAGGRAWDLVRLYTFFHNFCDFLMNFFLFCRLMFVFMNGVFVFMLRANIN